MNQREGELGSPSKFKARPFSVNQVTNRTASSNGRNGNGSGGIYKGRVLGNALVVTLGWFQLGYGYISWTNLEPAFSVYFGWNESETKFWGDVNTSVLVLGTWTGSVIMSN